MPRKKHTLCVTLIVPLLELTAVLAGALAKTTQSPFGFFLVMLAVSLGTAVFPREPAC